MSRRGRDLTPDEKKLWRRVAAHVRTRKPLAPEDEAPASEPPPRPKHAVTVAPPAPLVKARTPAPPADRGGEKRIRRGKLEIGGSLDLHGHTQESAREALARFLQRAQQRGDRTVIVITGVGRAGQGILKQRLPEWLAERELRGRVSGFAQAHRSHGGAGAYYVFLKPRRE